MTTTITTSQGVEAVLTGLKGYRFLNLTTFRKSGVPVLTTVLFALANDKKIYVWMPKDSGKVKRIRNDASVQIAPSTRRSRPLGPIAAATARILSVTEQREAQTVTDREFGWLKRKTMSELQTPQHREKAITLTLLRKTRRGFP
jgi:uncharacterized protein